MSTYFLVNIIIIFSTGPNVTTHIFDDRDEALEFFDAVCDDESDRDDNLPVIVTLSQMVNAYPYSAFATKCWSKNC